LRLHLIGDAKNLVKFDNTGMDFLNGFYQNNKLSFVDIDNVKEVYDLINKLKYKK